MPRQSKIQSTRPTSLATPDNERRYYCSTCGKSFKRQNTNFPMSQSPLYKGNSGYITSCRNCVDDLFNHYKAILSDEKAALKRVCMKFDIYWHEDIYNMLTKANTSSSRVLAYISRSNLIKYQGKTYDDTLDEEARLGIGDATPLNNVDDLPAVTDSVKAFWGAGLSEQLYRELEERLQYWLSKYPKNVELEIGEEALLKQICILENQINKDVMNGKSTDKSAQALNTLLGSANLRPVQQRYDASEQELEEMPLGVGLYKWEKTRPLPDTAPEFQDVDNIVKYISTWFFGHTAKMVGLKNSFSKLYEQAIAKLRVEKPEYEEDSDDDLLANIFGDEGEDVNG